MCVNNVRNHFHWKLHLLIIYVFTATPLIYVNLVQRNFKAGLDIWNMWKNVQCQYLQIVKMTLPILMPFLWSSKVRYCYGKNRSFCLHYFAFTYLHIPWYFLDICLKDPTLDAIIFFKEDTVQLALNGTQFCRWNYGI